MQTLIIDAGATKSDFVLLSDGELLCRHCGAGMNPNYSTEAEMMQVFADFVPKCPKGVIERVCYYGSGCALPHNAGLMASLMVRFFPFADIRVYSDLIAVCHALSRGQRSVVAILGTGAASCQFDGREIERRAPSLGYLLGDEGSGTNLGKRLLTLYLSGQLPEPLCDALEREHQLSFERAIRRIYREPEPNRMMSQLSPFVRQHISEPIVRQMALEAFAAFFATQKRHYPEWETLRWNLAGSVAHHYSDLIREAAACEHCTLGTVVASPMEKLIEYYKELK